MSGASVKVVEVASPDSGALNPVDLATIEQIELDTPVSNKDVASVVEIQDADDDDEKLPPSPRIPDMASVVSSMAELRAGAGAAAGPDLSRLPPDVQEMMKKMEQYRSMRPGPRAHGLGLPDALGRVATPVGTGQGLTPVGASQGATLAPLGPNMPTRASVETKEEKKKVTFKDTPVQNQGLTQQDPTQHDPTQHDTQYDMPAVDFKSLSKDINNLKSALASLYVPKHFDSLMKKVGSIEENTAKAQASMNTCYNATFFIFMMFLLFTLGVVYIIWRMNYFKFLFRQNLHGRYTRPKACYACYRPWRKRACRSAPIKDHFSAPELVADYRDAPRPQAMDNVTSSSSEAASEADVEVEVAA